MELLLPFRREFQIQHKHGRDASQSAHQHLHGTLYHLSKINPITDCEKAVMFELRCFAYLCTDRVNDALQALQLLEALGTSSTSKKEMHLFWKLLFRLEQPLLTATTSEDASWKRAFDAWQVKLKTWLDIPTPFHDRIQRVYRMSPKISTTEEQNLYDGVYNHLGFFRGCLHVQQYPSHVAILTAFVESKATQALVLDPRVRLDDSSLPKLEALFQTTDTSGWRSLVSAKTEDPSIAYIIDLPSATKALAEYKTTLPFASCRFLEVPVLSASVVFSNIDQKNSISNPNSNLNPQPQPKSRGDEDNNDQGLKNWIVFVAEQWTPHVEAQWKELQSQANNSAWLIVSPGTAELKAKFPLHERSNHHVFVLSHEDCQVHNKFHSHEFGQSLDSLIGIWWSWLKQEFKAAGKPGDECKTTWFVQPDRVRALYNRWVPVLTRLNDAYPEDSNDLLCCNLNSYHQKPDWYWWSRLNLQISESGKLLTWGAGIQNDNAWMSYQAIYRISPNMMNDIGLGLGNVSCISECLLPTLAVARTKQNHGQGTETQKAWLPKRIASSWFGTHTQDGSELSGVDKQLTLSALYSIWTSTHFTDDSKVAPFLSLIVPPSGTFPDMDLMEKKLALAEAEAHVKVEKSIVIAKKSGLSPCASSVLVEHMAIALTKTDNDDDEEDDDEKDKNVDGQDNTMLGKIRQELFVKPLVLWEPPKSIRSMEVDDMWFSYKWVANLATIDNCMTVLDINTKVDDYHMYLTKRPGCNLVNVYRLEGDTTFKEWHRQMGGASLQVVRSSHLKPAETTKAVSFLTELPAKSRPTICVFRHCNTEAVTATDAEKLASVWKHWYVFDYSAQRLTAVPADKMSSLPSAPFCCALKPLEYLFCTDKLFVW